MQKHLPFAIALLVILSYLDFLGLSLIPYFARIGATFIAPLVAVAFLIIKIVYKPEISVKRGFAIPILIMIVSTFISFIAAKFIHSQSFAQSLWASKYIFYYFIYFYLHEYKIDIEPLEKFIISLGVATVIFYYLQLALYPNLIFDITIMQDRNTLRMFFPSLLCSKVAYLYFLNKTFLEKKWYYILISLAILSVFILQATRQTIFTFVFLTIIYILNSKQVKNKVIIVFLVISLIVSSVFIFEGIIQQMFELTFSQAESVQDNVRVKAAEFYLTRGTPSPLAYIIGNGPPDDSSRFGQYLFFWTLKNGFYLSDIGIIGDYYKYGLFFIITGFYLYYKSLKSKLSGRYSYWKYYILSTILVMFTGRGYLGNAEIHLIIAFYVIDIDRFNSSQKINSKNEQDSD